MAGGKMGCKATEYQNTRVTSIIIQKVLGLQLKMKKTRAKNNLGFKQNLIPTNQCCI
jgi:hypothetical protein